MKYANVTSTLALVVALSGTGYAAGALPRNSVTSAQVKDGSLKVKDVKATELARLRGPAGAAGPAGPSGPSGPSGPAGPAGTFPAASSALVPVAVVRVDAAGVLRPGSRFRAPATGTPTVTRSFAGVYDIAVPGVVYDADDIAVCTLGQGARGTVSIGSNLGRLTVFTYDPNQNAADRGFVCAVYDPV